MNKNPNKELQKPTSRKWKKIKWLNATSQHIDTTTGELLTKKQIQHGNYLKVHTDHLYTIEEKRPIGHHHRINKYIRQSEHQPTLF